MRRLSGKADASTKPSRLLSWFATMTSGPSEGRSTGEAIFIRKANRKIRAVRNRVITYNVGTSSESLRGILDSAQDLVRAIVY